MKLSVVVPVYRAEKTLRQCVESILKQDYEDMEIILVDDGSPDNCPQICDQMGQDWVQVKVVHRKNGGLSAARNTGISMARGEYVTFVDSDDCLERDTLQPLMMILHDNPDIDLLEYPVDVKGKTRLDFNDEWFSTVMEYWTKTRAYSHTYACNKIFRISLFNEVKFPEGKTFEDAWTFPKLLKNVRVVVTSARGLYVYRCNNESITEKAGGEELMSLLEAHLASSFPIPLIYLLNIQLDVYRMTGKILLRDGLVPEPVHNAKENVKLFMYKHFGIRMLCCVHKFFIGLRGGSLS